MESLPQELINKIALHLERCPDEPQVPILQQQVTHSSKLPPFATISSHWREAVEFVTFHSLRIKSDELSHFQAMVTGNRRKHLTKLSFEVLLPEYSEEACGRVESQEEQKLNNRTFTQGIRDLFSILKMWEDEGLQSILRLELPYGNAFSPTDLRLRNREQIRLEIAQRKRGKDIFEQRFEQSLLELSEPSEVPTLSNIQYLNIRGNTTRKLAPSVGPGLAASLPNLKGISWEFGECDDQTIKIDNRISFARALGQTKLRHCSAAVIVFHHENPFDQRAAGQSRVPSGALYDPFSACLRFFSENLTSLTLSGYLDSTLFWPSSDEVNSIPTWPYLRKLKIVFNMVTPSGDWYFIGTAPEPHENDNPAEGIIGGDGDGDSDYTNFREHGNEATLDPLLTAFVKAIQRMPVLEHFMLESELGNEKGFFEISFYAPGLVAEWGDENNEDARVRRLYYTVGEVWRPNDVIVEGLRSAGREKYGEEIIERFLEPRCWRY